MHGVKKRLIVRLSSLGDVILAMSALEVQPKAAFDWVVSREYAEVLKGHPQIGRVWEFDRARGLHGWRELMNQISREGYDEVYDLHRTLRSSLLKLHLRTASLFSTGQMPRWHGVKKDKGRLFGFFFFKALWPKTWRPLAVARQSALCANGSGEERPNLRHLLAGASRPELLELFRHWDESARAVGKPAVCVMPSSKWKSKNWPVTHYVELLSRLPVLSIVLGTSRDNESQQLCEALSRRGLPFVSAVGDWSLSEAAKILVRSSRYLGSDTGLAHLSEGIGVPALVIYGPTHEDIGFGPWLSESRSIGLHLGCRPCGKDGRYCYRFWDSYACLRSLSPESVLHQLRNSHALS